MLSFALEGRNEVVDNLPFLEWDEQEVAHGFLCGVAFDEGIHALVYTFRHHFVAVYSGLQYPVSSTKERGPVAMLAVLRGDRPSNRMPNVVTL